MSVCLSSCVRVRVCLLFVCLVVCPYVCLLLYGFACESVYSCVSLFERVFHCLLVVCFIAACVCVCLFLWLWFHGVVCSLILSVVYVRVSVVSLFVCLVVCVDLCWCVYLFCCLRV